MNFLKLIIFVLCSIPLPSFAQIDDSSIITRQSIEDFMAHRQMIEQRNIDFTREIASIDRNNIKQELSKELRSIKKLSEKTLYNDEKLELHKRYRRAVRLAYAENRDCEDKYLQILTKLRNYAWNAHDTLWAAVFEIEYNNLKAFNNN